MPLIAPILRGLSSFPVVRSKSRPRALRLFNVVQCSSLACNWLARFGRSSDLFSVRIPVWPDGCNIRRSTSCVTLVDSNKFFFLCSTVCVNVTLRFKLFNTLRHNFLMRDSSSAPIRIRRPSRRMHFPGRFLRARQAIRRGGRASF